EALGHRSLLRGPLPHPQVLGPLVRVAALAVPQLQEQGPTLIARLAAQLLDKDCHAGRLALLDRRADPRHVTGPGPAPTLAADDDPIEGPGRGRWDVDPVHLGVIVGGNPDRQLAGERVPVA